MSYPKHDFSSLIDTDFSYSNKVNNRKNIDNPMCDNNIMLEPRLQEYINKKKYYKKYNINPSISLEKEFSITNYDKKIIKRFFKGKKDMYNTDNLEINRTKLKNKNIFPSKKFRKDDKRMNNFNYNNENLDKPLNLGMFSPDEDGDYYEYEQENNNDTREIFDSRDFDDSRFDPRVDPRIRPGNKDFNPNKSHYNVNGQVTDRLYNDGGKFNGNEVIFNQMIDKSVLGAVPNKYRSRSANPVQQKQLKWNKNNSEAIYGCSKKLYENNNNNQYIDHNKNVCETDLETQMIHGVPSKGAKSYGYRNPEEHYYDYIDPEFQNEKNTTDLPYHGFGFPSRQINRTRSGGAYKRNIY